MTTLLGSANKSVTTRREGLLGGQYPLEQATLLRELKRLCAEKNFDLILLHRSLIDCVQPQDHRANRQVPPDLRL